MLAIDLLDTGGDWFQFIFFLLISCIIPMIVFTFFDLYRYSTRLISIFLSLILWRLVYDYDIIFGILVGSLIGVLWAIINLQNQPNEKLKLVWEAITFSHVVNGLVMLLKILIFIL